MQKFEYLENEKSFLDEIKNIFHSFWRAIMWRKIKISCKIADTSFNVKISGISSPWTQEDILDCTSCVLGFFHVQEKIG